MQTVRSQASHRHAAAWHQLHDLLCSGQTPAAARCLLKPAPKAAFQQLGSPWWPVACCGHPSSSWPLRAAESSGLCWWHCARQSVPVLPAQGHLHARQQCQHVKLVHSSHGSWSRDLHGLVSQRALAWVHTSKLPGRLHCSIKGSSIKAETGVEIVLCHAGKRRRR